MGMSTKPAFGALSDRRGAFAIAYSRHHNASQAAREAGYAQGCASVTGTRLLANASVLARIGELEAQTALDMGISRDRLLLELQGAATLAKEKREPMAMIAAWREIAKICGFYHPARVRVAVDLSGQGELARMDRMTDSELMAIIVKGG